MADGVHRDIRKPKDSQRIPDVLEHPKHGRTGDHCLYRLQPDGGAILLRIPSTCGRRRRDRNGSFHRHRIAAEAAGC